MDKAEIESEKIQDIEFPLRATLQETYIAISLPEGIEEFSKKGYGIPKEGNLHLTFYEALFLLGKGAINVKDEKNKKNLVFQDLLTHFQSIDKDAWARYLIYRDLRSRGYVAREGFGMGIDFRLYERGDYGKGTAKHLIFGIQEGQPVTVKKLARVQRYVQNLKKNLVLAVINRRGEIVYYSLSELNLK
ncbi:tRNA-intron lyase [Candidatus Bathyarchaeota archaeon]|nr:tRNA-intron lyase [Candidatus Bathyarchaeota archaeon]